MQRHHRGSVAEMVTRDQFDPDRVPSSVDGRASDVLLIHVLPMISVVVPVRNESARLAETVGQLVAQDYPRDRFEILIVDGESTDATIQIAHALADVHANIRVLSNPRRLSSAARNIGIKNARGDLIVIVDGHCELDGRRYLSNVAEAFRTSGADCLGRPQPLNVTHASPLQRAIAAARSHWLGHHPDSFIYSTKEQFVPAKSVAVAYTRSVFECVGAFDESFDACEDVELNHRIDQSGLRCFFTPKIEIRYVPRSSLRALFYQMVRYGRGRVRLLRKHPDTFSAGGFIPALWLAGLFLGPLACLALPPLWWVYLSVLVIYALVVLLVSARIALHRRSPRMLPFLPLTFSTIHAGAGWGVLREVLFSWRR